MRTLDPKEYGRSSSLGVHRVFGRAIDQPVGIALDVVGIFLRRDLGQQVTQSLIRRVGPSELFTAHFRGTESGVLPDTVGPVHTSTRSPSTLSSFQLTASFPERSESMSTSSIPAGKSPL